MTTAEQLDMLEKELGEALSLNVYNQFTQLWHLLLRLSMDEPRSDEFARITSLVSRLPIDSVTRVLANGGVDQLVNLDPPLETVLVHQHERLEFLNAQRSLAAVRTRRVDAPCEALSELGFVLKRIRNKLEHGFKTPEGLRDREILGAACPVVELLLRECLALLRAEAAHAVAVSP